MRYTDLELFDEVRHKILGHYMEDCDWDINVNYDFNYSGRNFSEEEETTIAMMILEEMPYLQVYDDGGEIKVKRIAPILERDQLFYYKHNYLQLQNEHCKVFDALDRITNGIY